MGEVDYMSNSGNKSHQLSTRDVLKDSTVDVLTISAGTNAECVLATAGTTPPLVELVDVTVLL